MLAERLFGVFIFFARTTFAWFTSKDEVTNRLTANSDYGVSIVESFTPPKNWIPGQEINKDVYAVNTGSIAAFVKESISGNLTYTYEKRTGVAPDESGKPEEYVELDKNIVRAIDGATSQEAGGFLAWTNAKTPVVAKSYKVDDVEYTVGATEYDGYDGTNTVKFVDLTPANGSGTSYKIKKSDLKTDGAALYSDVGTVPQAAVTGVAATPYTDYELTLDSTYQINNVQYNIDGTAIAGFLGTENTSFYKLTRVGTDESMPAELYVTSAAPASNAALYSNVGTPSSAAVVGVPAAPANKTVAIETEGGDAPITPGPVNSATLTDLAESKDDDNTTEVHGTVTSRWHPTETGIYIFRRSYVPAVKDNPATTEDETKAGYYTYAGYYYVASNTPDDLNTPEDESEGKYYKIVIGDDKFRANNDAEVEADTTGETNFVFDVSADQSALGDAVDVNEDGSLVGAVRYQYVKEVKVENVKPTLTYHGETTDKPAYLTATYSDESTEEGADAASKQAAYEQAKAEADAARQEYLDKLGDAAASEVDYENALGAYNTALSRYNQAKADWDYAKALSNASKALIDAAAERAAAEKKKDDAEAALKAAYKAVTDEANELATDGRSSSTAAGTDAGKFGDLLTVGLGTEDKNDISYADIFQITRNYTGLNGNTSGKLEDKINALLASSAGNAANRDELTKAQEYMGEMKTLWDDTQTEPATPATDASIVGASKRLSDAIDALKADKFNYDDPTDTAKYVEDAMKEIYAARQKLEDNLKDYKALYQKLELAAGTEPQLTELLSTGDNSTSFGDKIDAWITRIGDLETRLEALNDDANIGKKVYTADTIKGGADYGEDARVQDYIIKYNNYVDELANVEDAKKDWKTAVETYNKAVSKGQTDYIAAIESNQQKNDVNGKLAKNDYEGLDKATDNSKWYLTNNNDALVGLYAVDRDSTQVASTTDANNTSNTIQFKGADDTADNFVDPQITYTEDGWQTIGKDGTSLTTTIDDANYGYYETTTATKTSPAAYTAATYNTSTGVVTDGSYTKAVIAVNTAETAFKTLKANTHSGATANETVDNLYKAAYNTGDNDLLTKKNTAEQAYKDAVKAATTAEEASTKAAGRASNALAAAGTAAADDESRIEIIINLAEEASKLDWTSALGNHESAQVADFYYNYILEAGETSSKLIDSVQLSPSVGTSDYKTLEFDLNVALDSAQITYADDQRTITSTAVDSNDAFKKNVKTIDQETLAVEWEPNEASASADTKYRVGLNVVEPKTYEGGNKEKSNVALPYTFKIGDDNYYGEEVKDGATFYKWDATNDTWATDDTAVKLIEIK